ncbi:MAG: biopolymer transporter ExbD [Burkholderiaceae bacterium]|nr:biopolymer transporter ExbD [Burkholderiaceae bacterium]
MAFGRLERAAASRPMSDINMTPLIDVMLVLLVIFIVTAPLIGQSLKLDLPKSAAGTPNETPAFVALALDAQGQLFLAGAVATPEAVTKAVRDAARKDPDTEVQLRADQAVPYGRVAELIGLVQQAGLNRIGFVTEAPAAPAGTPK